MINQKIVENVYKNVFGLKKTDKILIITDTIKKSIAQDFFKYLQENNYDSAVIVIEPTGQHGKEPDKKTADLMKKFNVQLYITEYSLSHTKARRYATDNGARIASMPGITEDMIKRTFDVDYKKMIKLSDDICRMLKSTKEITVTTKAGTNIILTQGCTPKGMKSDMIKSSKTFDNLPFGEISFRPDFIAGTFVVDGSLPVLGKLKSPVKFHVVDGVATKIEGKNIKKYVDTLKKVGPNAYKIAEFGIGLNPKAKITGEILEDEKILGTIHIALGNDVSYGGNNNVPLHFDGVIKSPNIFFDKKQIMKDGKFTF